MAKNKTNPDAFFKDIKKEINESKEKAEKNAKGQKQSHVKKYMQNNAQNNVKNTVENYVKNDVKKAIYNSIKNNEENNVQKAAQSSVESNPPKPVLNFNLKVKDTKKSKNFYLKESTIKNITKYAKKYKMKDSEFVENILNQFFEMEK